MSAFYNKNFELINNECNSFSNIPVELIEIASKQQYIICIKTAGFDYFHLDACKTLFCAIFEALPHKHDAQENVSSIINMRRKNLFLDRIEFI